MLTGSNRALQLSSNTSVHTHAAAGYFWKKLLLCEDINRERLDHALLGGDRRPSASVVARPSIAIIDKTMSLSAAPCLQWSLDQTAGGIISITRGLIQAATSDNVQISALLVCEQFGTTLPICSITRMKVEQMARQKHSQPLRFMKAQAGFSAGDSADILSRTDGGVRFLCFAAILVSGGENGIQSAELLESLVRKTSKADQMLPTLLQLNDLLRALRPKLLNSGLVAEVIGWSHVCLSSRDALRDICTPNAARIQQLVDALSQCFRVGEESNSVRVESDKAHIPWIISVVKWFLGKPPNVLGIDGSKMFESGSLRATVIERQNFPFDFEVFICRKVESLDQLILIEGGPADRKVNYMSGLIDVQLWSKLQMKAFDLPAELCGQVLYYVLKELAPRIVMSATMVRFVKECQGTDKESLLSNPFYDLTTNLSAFKHILGEQVPLPTEDPDLTILGEHIREQCSKCTTCRKGHDWSPTPTHRRESLTLDDEGFHYNVKTPIAACHGSGYYNVYAKEQCFKLRVGLFAADVLALSLFNSDRQMQNFPGLAYPCNSAKSELDPLRLLRINIGEAVAESDSWYDLVVYGWWLLFTQKVSVLQCSCKTIFDAALSLLGHSELQQYRTTLSSDRGQVVYPGILEGRAATRIGYLQLRCIPGSLRWNGQTIRALTSGPVDTVQGSRSDHPMIGSAYVPVPRIEWDLPFGLSVNDLQGMTTLELSISVMSPSVPSYESTVMLSPWHLLEGTSRTIFSPPCAHARHTPAGVLGNEFCLAMDPSEVNIPWFEPGQEQLLVPHHGDSFAQIAQLGMVDECCVLHYDGCIRCALQLAKDMDVKMVIC